MALNDFRVSTVDGSFGCHVAVPVGRPRGAIVVIQEIFGVNAGIRGIADHYASLGYLAVAPDLFWRIRPGVDLTDQSEEEWKEAFALFNAFDVARGVEDIQATIKQTRSVIDGGKVGAVGYCLGGLLAYLTACHTDADASVGYYGVSIDKRLDDAGGLSKPLMLHIAGRDQFVPMDAQQKIRTELAGLSEVTIHDYVAQDHAFARIGGQHYDADAASAANGRTEAFFASHVG
jgi:carboxymethylenebutenolidase